MVDVIEASLNICIQHKRGLFADRQKDHLNGSMTGIPSGRLSALPGLGIDTRRTGYDCMCLHWLGWIRSTMTSRRVGGTAFEPSTSAVFWPWLSCVTRRTASRRAARDFIRSLWSVWTARMLPRWLARKILFCMRYTCCSSLRQGNLRQLSLAASSGGLVPAFLPYDSSLFLPDHRADVSISTGFPSGVGFFGNPALKGMRVVPARRIDLRREHT